MVKIFLFFSEFGRGYLREWPNSYLARRASDSTSRQVAGRSYLVEEYFRQDDRIRF